MAAVLIQGALIQWFHLVTSLLKENQHLLGPFLRWIWWKDYVILSTVKKRLVDIWQHGYFDFDGVETS